MCGKADACNVEGDKIVMGKLRTIIKTDIPGAKFTYAKLKMAKEHLMTPIGMYYLWKLFHTLDSKCVIESPANIEKLNYKDMFYLHYALNSQDYNRFMENIISSNLNSLKKAEQVKISFILYDSSMWCGDYLYQLLRNDPLFDVEVVLSKRSDMISDTAEKAFQEGANKLKEAGLNIRVINSGDSYVADADILFFLTPYFNVLNSGLSLENLPVTKLICYVDYGIEISNGGTATDILMRKFIWKEFVDTESHLQDIQEKTYRKGAGEIYTGYPRMDTFYIADKPKYQWKTANPHAKKFIWAPHWSINDGVLYATFHKNWKFFYEYAKSHSDTTAWVVKPHPNLLDSAVKAGIFKDEDEFSDYLKAWNELPNAKVETGAYYQDIFKTSDAMILDSVSFTAEYMYAHKPELFLTRNTDNFNQVGKDIIDGLYTADGSDFNSIRAFIENVVVDCNDVKLNDRENAFKNHLDYYGKFGKLASQRIYDLIRSALGNGRL